MKRKHSGGKSNINSNSSPSESHEKRVRIAQNPSSSNPTDATATAPQIEVSSAIQSRSNEIKSLQHSLKVATTSSTTRAWQQLPRSERRRAASHNLLRLPKRLRSKGLHELQSSNTNPKSKSDIRKKSSLHPIGKSKRRRLELIQRASKDSRKWLETHLWHSKRFRMSGFKGKKDARIGRNDRWGFVLAEKPNMKSQRATLREAKKKCVLHDSSYESFIRISVQIPKMVKPKEYVRKNKDGKKRKQVLEDGAKEMWSKENVEKRKRKNWEEGTEVLGDLLKASGLNDGWSEDHNTGIRECQTTLLGKVEEEKQKSTKGKEREMDLGFCRALAPLKVLWIASSEQGVKDFASGSDPTTSKPAAQSSNPVARDNDAMEIDLLNPTDPIASTSTLTPSIKIGVPVIDQPSIQSQHLAQHQQNQKAASNNRQLKRKLYRTISSNKIPVSPTRELILRIHPGGIKDLRKSLIDGIKTLGGVGALPTHTKEFEPFNIKIQRHSKHLPSNQSQSQQQQEEDPLSNLFIHISELSTSPSPEISAGASRKTPASISKAEDRRHSTLETRKEMGIIPTSKGKKGKILKGKEREIETKKEKVDKEKEDEMVRNRRDEGWNVFELLGPDSGRVLGGVLKPVKSIDGKKKEMFRLLTKNLSPSDFPEGQVLSLEVHDPRISFPPTNSKHENLVSSSKDTKIESSSKNPEVLGSGLFFKTELARGNLQTKGKDGPRFSKGDIHSRKAKLLIPGAPLQPTSEDDIIPVVLIQRTLSSHSTTPKTSISISNSTTEETTNPSSTSPLCGWTLLVPRGWGSAFWLSLVHTGSRVLGQDQIKQLGFEGHSMASLSSPLSSSSNPQSSPLNLNSTPLRSSLALAYPLSWTSTTASKVEENMVSKLDRMEWERRPKGKRTEFEKVGVKFPWGGEEMWREILKFGAEIRIEKIDQETRKDRIIKPWLLHVNSTNRDQLMQMAADEADGKSLVQQFFNSSRRNAGEAEPLKEDDSIFIEKALDNALVLVSITAIKRGAFHDGSGIYLIKDAKDEEEWRECLDRVKDQGGDEKVESEDDSEDDEDESGSEGEGDDQEIQDEDELSMGNGSSKKQDVIQEMEELKALLGGARAASSIRRGNIEKKGKGKSKLSKDLRDYLGKDDQLNKNLHQLESTSPSAPPLLVGSVPLGGFSLSIGKGFAVATMSFRAYLEVLRRSSEASNKAGKEPYTLVLVRERNGGIWRAGNIKLAVM